MADYKGKLSGNEIDQLPVRITELSNKLNPILSSEAARDKAEAERKASEIKREQGEIERGKTFTTSQAQRQTAFSTEQTQRQTEFSTEQTHRQTEFTNQLNEMRDNAASFISVASPSDIHSLFAPSLTLTPSTLRFTAQYTPSYITTDFALPNGTPENFHEGDYIKIRYDGNQELTYTYAGEPGAYMMFVGPQGGDHAHIHFYDDICTDNFQFYATLEGKGNQDTFQVIELRILGQLYTVSGQTADPANPKVVTTANLAEFKQQLEVKMEDFAPNSSDENFILGNKVFVGGILEGDSLRLIGEPYSIAGDKVVING